MHKYKKSRYLVAVERIIGLDETLVYSTLTGKINIFSEDLWHCIANGALDEIPEDIITELVRKSILVGETSDELRNVLHKNSLEIQKSDTLYEVIQPTAFCQMGCFYCGQEHTNFTISDPTINLICERISAKIKNGNYKYLKIGWFGAEPTIAMASIKKITEKLMALCREYNIEFSAKIITNGLAITSDLLVEMATSLKIDAIEFTLDGDRESHDARRFLKNGKGTFMKIYGNLKKAIDAKRSNGLPIRITVRCNVDSHNVTATLALIRLLKEDNILDRISFYVAPVYKWGANNNEQALERQYFAEKDIFWKLKLLENGYNISRDLLPNRVYNTCLTTKKDSEVYDAYGNIFNCTEIPYTTQATKSPFYNGKVAQLPEVAAQGYLYNWFEGVEKNKDLPCHSCEMLPVCGGGCPKSWGEGNIPCPPFKFNFRERLSMFYILKKEQNFDTAIGQIKNMIEA